MNDITDSFPNEGFDNSERIELDLGEIDKGKIEAYLASILELINAKANTPSDIEPKTRYYLDISQDLQEMINRGEAWFTEKKKNGKPIAQLRHYDDEGRDRIYTYPAIKEEKIANLNENAPKGPDLYQMALMQQVAEISEEMKEVHKAVEQMHIDIQNNTFAMIESAYNQLLVADSVSNPVVRANQINNAIQTLLEGKQEIQKALETRLNEFESVPERNINLYYKMFTSKDYIGKKQKELDEICRLFDYFDKAGLIHVRACMMLNEPEAAKAAVKLHKDQFKALNRSRVETITRLISFESEEDEWFISPETYLSNVENQQRLLEEQRENGITLVLTGEQLMEAIENGKEQ